MAREKRTVIISDLSGVAVPDEEAVTITIRYADSRPQIRIDAAASEVDDLARKGRPARVRRPRA